MAFALKDSRLIAANSANPSYGAVLFAAEVLYYCMPEEAKSLATGITKPFPSGRLVFGTAAQTAIRLVLKTWVKQVVWKEDFKCPI